MTGDTSYRGAAILSVLLKHWGAVEKHTGDVSFNTPWAMHPLDASCLLDHLIDKLEAPPTPRPCGDFILYSRRIIVDENALRISL